MIEHWTRERPDLDSSSLGVLARVSRLARVAEANAGAVLSQFGVSEVEFLLLAAIRTAPDQQPAPRDLLNSLMVTSGGLTNRADRLESLGLVERIANPADRRGILLQLTESGRELVNRVTTAYVENQKMILGAALDDQERATLASLLQKLLSSLVRNEEQRATAKRAAPRPRGRRTRRRPVVSPVGHPSRLPDPE